MGTAPKALPAPSFCPVGPGEELGGSSGSGDMSLGALKEIGGEKVKKNFFLRKNFFHMFNLLHLKNPKNFSPRAQQIFFDSDLLGSTRIYSHLAQSPKLASTRTNSDLLGLRVIWNPCSLAWSGLVQHHPAWSSVGWCPSKNAYPPPE